MSSRRNRLAASSLGWILRVLGVFSGALPGCVPSDALDGRPCPCAEEPGWYCADGICVRGERPDAGGRDGGVVVDGGPPDAGPAGDDAGTDAGLDEPPAIPTDCWTRTTQCDWSDPLGFELVEGDASVLADVTLSSNPTFSPDGCELYYTLSGVMSVARRASSSSPFVPAGPLDSVDQSGSANSKASISPNGLELFFTSNRTDGTYHTIHRTARALPEGPWGVVTEVSTLSFSAVNNWDGVLAPHGLRYYWTPMRPGGQDIFVGERASLDAPFGAGVALAELAGMGHDAEPSVSADDRVLTLISDAAGLGGGSQLAYATRSGWRERFGTVRPAPGALLEGGSEYDSTMSADACEVLVRKSGELLYLVYEAR